MILTLLAEPTLAKRPMAALSKVIISSSVVSAPTCTTWLPLPSPKVKSPTKSVGTFKASLVLTLTVVAPWAATLMPRLTLTSRSCTCKVKPSKPTTLAEPAVACKLVK